MILAISPFIDATDQTGTDWAYLRKLGIVLVVGYAATVIFALPVYLAFRRRVARSLFLTVFLSSAITASPWLMALIFAKNGYLEKQGWVSFIQNISVYAFAGFIGGAVFWIIAYLPLNRYRQNWRQFW